MKKKRTKEKKQTSVGKFKRLAHPALAVTMPENWMNKPWHSMVLPEASVVQVIKNIPSRVTEQTDEITIKFVDLVGREVTGWLARNTVLKDCDKKKLSRGISELRVAAWDTLRERITMHHGWNAMTWIATFGHLNVPLLHAVIRELGGVVPKTDDGDTASVRALRLILGNKELQMSAVKKARKSGSSKTSSKKSKVARGARAKKSSRGGGRVSAFAGKVIRRLVKENPRREGSKGYKNWKVYRKGLTYEDFIKAGGVRGCLAKDIKRGHVKLVSA